ncbi:hydroxylysine kinase isoform X2 [Corythoichthys intestinalis]|uniref:hydroxylysine kinase isoform X2 n=1 Tax=Corythoichthys intestinalis TaxID=161448 RepID=UPI0025A5E526|nr:hydroxylysine kinase isoform X2 [Corythoichthys intestinalis]
MAANNTKPKLSKSQAAEIVQKHYKLTPTNLRFLPSYDDQNIYIATVEGGEYLLKIMNTVHTRDPTLIELQSYAMNFLHQSGLPTQTTLKTTTGQLMIQEDIDCGYGLQKYLVRLLTYLPGIPIAEVPLSPELLYQVGRIAATMDNILQKMEHPQLNVLQRDGFIWSLSNICLLEKWLNVLDGDPLLEIVKSVLHQFKTAVAPKYSSFRECLIHGDFNDLNVLVQENEKNGYKISGIIDFGDLNFGCYVNELAVTIAYMMLEHPNPLEPENEEYLMCSSKKGIPLLRKLFEIGKEQVEKVWVKSAAEFRDSQPSS